MATVSTDRAESPPFLATLPKRWRLAIIGLLMLGDITIVAYALREVWYGRYGVICLCLVFAIVLGPVKLGSRIAGRDVGEDFQNWMVRHPWFTRLYISAVVVLVVYANITNFASFQR